MFALMRARSNSSSSSTASSPSTPSLSPSGWNPSRPTISPPSVTPVTPAPTSDASSSPEREYFPASHSQTSKLATSPGLLPFAFSATPHRHTAYPCWPARDALDPAFAPAAGGAAGAGAAPPSSRISDEDLLDLDLPCAPPARHADDEVFLDDGDDAGLGISWSAVGGANVPPLAARVPERRRRLPPPPAPVVRRRSSSRGTKRKGRAPALAVIAE